jgi:hypothetical protein
MQCKSSAVHEPGASSGLGRTLTLVFDGLDHSPPYVDVLDKPALSAWCLTTYGVSGWL